MLVHTPERLFSIVVLLTTAHSSVEKGKLSKQIAFQGSTFYLFTSGLVALLIVPFLPWLNYGPFSTLFPSQASLVYLFMRGFRVDLTLYLTGVGTTIIAAAVARRPVSFKEYFR